MKEDSRNLLTASIILALITFFCIICVSANAQEIKREGNTFVQVSNLQQSHDVQTPYFYKVKEMSYSIWITSKGRCYIVRLSKNGNPYKQYLSKDICLQICEELNIQYQE